MTQSDPAPSVAPFPGPLRQTFEFAIQVIVLVATFNLFERGARWAGTLPIGVYRGTFIGAGFVDRLTEDPRWIAAVALAVTFALVASKIWVKRGGRTHAPKGWFDPWSAIAYGVPLRLFVTTVAAISAWSFSSYDYNLYFDQAHLLDRALLLLLLVAVWWRPIFILVFVPYLVAMVGQFDHPMGSFPWTEINVPIRVLVLIGAAFVLRCLTARSWIEPLLVVLACLIAANYWYSGLGKLRIDWFDHRHLNLLLIGGYVNGWLTPVAPETIVRLSEAARWFNVPLMLFTLVVEWGALFLLWRRWTLVGFLFCAMAFHAGVFAFTGMLFWKWIVTEAAFVFFLLRPALVRSLGLFTLPRFAMSFLLILGCQVWVSPTNLSWYDTPLTYSVRIVGVAPNGLSYELPTRLFTPYSDAFFLGGFQYLSSTKQVTSVMGAAWVRDVADALVTARTPEQVFAVEAAFPGNTFDPEQSAHFDDFIRTFVGTLNQYGRKPVVPRPFGAPAHLWSVPKDDAYDFQHPIDRVLVTHVLTFYDGQQLRVIDRRVLREIDIGTGSAVP